ncbi:ATP-binding protein [Sedimenticola sp.]|uniref:ATP-binding protein n=1 Tax=Sedimenticola sp. TaxID=1940285 RepID=UPI003D0E09E8
MTKPVSIRKRLLLSLIGLIGITWLGIFILVNRDATHELEEIYDASLAQNARILFGLLQQEIKEGEVELIRNIELNDKFLHDYELNIAFSANMGKLIIQSKDSPDFLTTLPEGFSDYTFNGKKWRVFTLKDDQTGLIIHTAQKLEAREELVSYLIKDTLAVIMFILPLLGLFIWLGISRSLKPLKQLVNEAAGMDPHSLRPFNTDDAPAEVSPLINALNQLLERLNRTIENERRFTADAAHELRTPLAGLKVQLQVALRAVDDQQKAKAMNKALEGIDRTTHLVNQLLTLARADRESASTLSFVSVDLVGLARDVIASLQEEADKRQISLSLDSGQPHYRVNGETTMLQIMLRNLLENAIKYAPTPGQAGIRLSGEAGRVRLDIWDSGSGIAKHTLELMFQRFRRGEQTDANGSGLGLSIVKRIAEIHEAEIEVNHTTNGSGFRVSLLFQLV